MAQSISQIIQDAQVDILKTPPHSLEAEQSVLGGLLLENTAWDRVGDLFAPAAYEPLIREVRLADLPALAGEILAGKVAGRIIVNPRDRATS